MIASLCAEFLYDWETYIVSEYMYISMENALKFSYVSIFPVEMRVLITWIKGAVKRIWNLRISSSSHENNLLQISHYNTFYFLRYVRTWDVLHVCLQTFRKNRICWLITSPVNNSRILWNKNTKFSVYCFFINTNI